MQAIAARASKPDSRRSTMMKTTPPVQSRCGVILTDDGYMALDKALTPYVREGPIGKYLYGTSVDYIGSFLTLTIHPDLVDNRIANEMTIWIPTHHVLFVAVSSNPNLTGFHNSERTDA